MNCSSLAQIIWISDLANSIEKFTMYIHEDTNYGITPERPAAKSKGINLRIINEIVLSVYPIVKKNYQV